MLHLNVRAKTDCEWLMFLRRLRWMTLAILAPELVMLFACGQWTSAQRSIAEMQGLGFTEWTMTHAYCADAGGFLLHSEDLASFPITAKQVHYLIQQGHIPSPKITRKEIWDKGKASYSPKQSQVLGLHGSWLKSSRRLSKIFPLRSWSCQQ